MTRGAERRIGKEPSEVQLYMRTWRTERAGVSTQTEWKKEWTETGGVPSEWTRNYNCNTKSASKRTNLLFLSDIEYYKS